ncbi:hypothetical protein C6I21_01580 [Alkalicoccus urumqiensis]|uniref:Uncharacterized protein n=1 Tax=Alkalicoccus urumqiensis TaxID=1548213 RepID=A0A2P6MLW3_ALKUR|nr:hypothetical protein C6I21_01580 [Alkalicoccus urumqiensis]
MKYEGFIAEACCRLSGEKPGCSIAGPLFSAAWRGMEKLDSDGALLEFAREKLDFRSWKLDFKAGVRMDHRVVGAADGVVRLQAAVVGLNPSEVRLCRKAPARITAAATPAAAIRIKPLSIMLQQQKDQAVSAWS